MSRRLRVWSRLVVGSVCVAVAAGSASRSGAQSAVGSANAIAYLGKGTIYLINADGTNRKPLVSGSANDTFNWSPDGKQIAFTAGKWGPPGEGTDTRIAIARVADKSVRTIAPKALYAPNEPTWSPDGKRIALAAFNWKEQRWSIYTIRSDGSGVRLLTHGAYGSGDDGSPDWSPDGRWIVFERYTANPRRTIMAVRPDGTGLHRIATVLTGPQCACPDWSPDATKIAYQASPTLTAIDYYPDIYMMNADGSHRVRLTHHPARDENPDWSPDGTKIAFYSERPGNAEIYTILASDGSHLTRVTRDPWYSALPRWRPTR